MLSLRPYPALLVVLSLTLIPSAIWASPTQRVAAGRLEVLSVKGEPLGTCPLKHTDVSVDISGFIARVTVRQHFANPFKDKIEAVYVFPLSQRAAVDEMTMTVGKRTIKGQIKERGEARAIYEAAKARGNVAGLLDQERPNIFTQAVANIEPGAEVDVTIAYSETLQWKDGQYEFSFPMTVEPRYMPGMPTGQPATGWSPPTDQVPDAAQISPPVTPEGTRAGHDLSLRVNLDAGLPICRLESRLHAVDVDYLVPDKSRARITLAANKTIPDKDFVLVYQTAGDEIADAVLAHTDSRGKFFTIVLQPPKRVRSPQIVPKEIIFAIDKSGSMHGFPIATAKKAMKLCIEGADENDTFNLICFDGGTSFCFDKPVLNTAANRRKALEFLESLEGAGGTEMMTAVHACLDGPFDPKRLRIVCFMTDGCNGADMDIIDAVHENAGTTRVFAFGIGYSVNRYLLDNIARAGRGEVQYILDERDTAGAAERFDERVRTPVLTDVKLDFSGVEVADVYPKSVPDLFSSTPIVVKGRYKHGGQGTITLRGRAGQGPFERKIPVQLPEDEPKNDVLAPLWARAAIDDLMNRDLTGIQNQQPDPALKKAIVEMAVNYKLLSQFTSFVAVEETTVTEGGRPRTVAVPVEMPAGVSYEGIFGPGGNASADGGWTYNPASSNATVVGHAGIGTGIAFGSGGSGSGFGGRGSGVRMMASAGGTKNTERAVTYSFIWIANHQGKDGNWRFDPPAGGEGGYANPGTWKSDAGATGLALLPFLGAGQTHKSKGPYKEHLVRGLAWLLRNQKADGDLAAGGSPKRLSHAWATIALSETYGLSGDKQVGIAAQKAIEFIEKSQDAKSGGWLESDDASSRLSVAAWQIMALDSARMAGLNTSTDVKKAAINFIAQHSDDQGVKFGETGKADVTARATAMGLFCRWNSYSLSGNSDLVSLSLSERLARRKPGAEYLLKQGPSSKDATLNFYATIFMHQVSDQDWDAWNRRMRDQAVHAQVREGDEKGSWFSADDADAAGGGRLYQTVINQLLLEVYYRYLPVFKNDPRFKNDPSR